jgi:hypothetical protein
MANVRVTLAILAPQGEEGRKAMMARLVMAF